MLQRAKSWLRKFLGFSPIAADRDSPEFILLRVQEHLSGQLTKFNRSLAASVGFCDTLQKQIRDLEAQECSVKVDLNAQIQKASSESMAGELALRLQALRDELADSRKRLAEAEETRAQITLNRDAAIANARKKMEELRGVPE